ncbi:hypothetical protein [Brachyspira sp.]|uniref:hypothetical protein n=1 Tax=Brachyspira sp. TaxID=1977261 RepID=UPI00260E1D11|nr:hypothetical protein [Brachyspira sp.]
MPRKTNKQQYFERYKKAYPELTKAEMESLYLFDTEYCNSDADVREFLETQCSSNEISQKEIDDSFYKIEKAQPTVSKAQLRKESMRAKAAQSDRLELLAKELEHYSFLFGDLVERTNTELRYIDSETGNGITVKIAKHKVQKVISKTIKRKPIKLENGKEEIAPYSTVELRAMAIENIILNHQELFEAPSLAGTQMGFVVKDSKYPFGSIKITHHKDRHF